MHRWARHVAAGTAGVIAVVFASCGSAPSGEQTQRDHAATTNSPATAITASSLPTTVTQPGVTVPQIIGLKIAAAHVALRDAGLPFVALNKPCNEGTLASQSVVDSLALAGKEPTPNVGAVAVEPGRMVPPGTRIGIRWSGCYGNAVVVPDVVGLPFANAKHAITGAGLTWACYSATKPKKASSSASTDAGLLSVRLSALSPGVVLTQSPHPGGVLRPGATVAFTMHACPQ